MPALEVFGATDRQLAQDGIHKHLLLLAVSICLALAWIAWMFLARVTVYAGTNQARVEVAQAVYFVQAPVSGRVARSFLELGKLVEAGTVLLELNTEPQKLKVQEQHTRRSALRAQLSDLRSQLAAEERTMAAESAASDAAIEQAQTNLAQADAQGRFAEEAAKKRAPAYREGLLSHWDLLKLESEARQKAAEVKSYRAAVTKAEQEKQAAASARQSRIEAIRSDIDRIVGEFGAADNTVLQLENDLSRHSIRAPSRGHLGTVINLKLGGYVHEGDRIAAIIPDGGLRVIAEFEPRIAMGRVRAGQLGRLRLDGFPWAQYGSVMATVIKVGSELRDGKVRVELDPSPKPGLTLQHGLPGTLQIVVERLSPAALLVRKAGGYLGRTTDSQPTAQNQNEGAPAQ